MKSISIVTSCEEKRYQDIDIAFTDDSIAPNGRKNIFVQAYNPFAPEIKLENITDEKELEMINEILYEIDGTIE